VIVLNPLITDGAILQAQEDVLIAGHTSVLGRYVARLGDEVQTALTDTSGNFLFRFAKRPYNTVESLVVDDIYIGDLHFGQVYLFAGQSNIEFKMQQETHFNEEEAWLAENELAIKYFQVPQIEYENGAEILPENLAWNGWQELNSQSLGQLSAAAYYAMKEFCAANPTIPVGIVECNKGGTSASAWISQEFLARSASIMESLVAPYQAQYQGKTDEELDLVTQAFYQTAEKYYALRAKWVKENPEMSLGEIKDIIGGSPWPPPATRKSFLRPSGLYQTMFQKITPFSFGAVVWYQGEEDSGNATIYEELLSLLIAQWRRDLMNEALPFYIVQLPIYNERAPKDWPLIRLAQANVAQKLANVYLEVTIDTGLVDDIHPPDKSLVGKRLGELIIQKHYANCPIAKIEQIKENSITLEVMSAKSLSETSFKLMFNEQMITAQVVDNKIEVPVNQKGTLSFAYEKVPEQTVFNEVGYPLSPFRFTIF